MYYTVYKITNNINGKFYIGAHKSKKLVDSYMGSGSIIRRAISKYGKQNFTKEILFYAFTEEMMFSVEMDLIVISSNILKFLKSKGIKFYEFNRDFNNVEYVKQILQEKA